MKAVLLVAYGGVDQLNYTEAPDPKPNPGEVLVKVAGTSLNPIDWKLRTGHVKNLMPLQLPAILGRDVAGEVVALGAGVTKFKKGDKVLGLVNQSYAELLTAKAEDLALIPEGLDMDQAAVIPLVTLTGAQLIEKGVRPKAGETVLVTGALGGVGRTAVFIAKLHGAIVIAGVRKSQKPEAQLLGADRVVARCHCRHSKRPRPRKALAEAEGGRSARHRPR
jgi:NADPH:quinone reductase-like Zn-dependent oxidoreductase